jgi:hypothetical protein
MWIEHDRFTIRPFDRRRASILTNSNESRNHSPDFRGIISTNVPRMTSTRKAQGTSLRAGLDINPIGPNIGLPHGRVAMNYDFAEILFAIRPCKIEHLNGASSVSRSSPRKPQICDARHSAGLAHGVWSASPDRHGAGYEHDQAR